MKQAVYNIFGIFFCLIICCKNPDKLASIKQPVFGGIVLGNKGSESLKIRDSLISAKKLFITQNTSREYFILTDETINYTDKLLLFPTFQMGKDSVILKAIYYIYSVQFLSQESYKNYHPLSLGYQAIQNSINQNENIYKFLTSDFATTKIVDNKYGIYVPNSPQHFLSIDLRQKITKYLNEKYGNPASEDTSGNFSEHDKDYTMETTWKTRNIDIRLIARRIGGAYRYDEFYHALIYQFNEETIKKYNLNSEIDLKNTF